MDNPQVEQTTEELSLQSIEQMDVEQLSQIDPEHFEKLLDEQEAKGFPVEEQVIQEETEPKEPNTDNSTDDDDSVVMSDADFRQFVTDKFRANHSDVQVTDPHEVRKLMQYGLNYHKKMAELAPHRRILKSLEKHGLTDESKVNFAIELMQGKPEAIAQLLKQHEVDTYNLPDLDETPYRADNYVPTDLAIQYEEAMNDISGSEKAMYVKQYLANIDSDSFSEVYSNPNYIRSLADQAERGLMQDALALVEKEYALGNIPEGTKQIDAYAYFAKQLSENNPEKYGLKPTKQQRKVIGNNLQQNQQVQQSNKHQASIPNNQQVQTHSHSGLDILLNASGEELSKYNGDWEAFLQANNINF